MFIPFMIVSLDYGCKRIMERVNGKIASQARNDGNRCIVIASLRSNPETGRGGWIASCLAMTDYRNDEHKKVQNSPK